MKVIERRRGIKGEKEREGERVKERERGTHSKGIKSEGNTGRVKVQLNC